MEKLFKSLKPATRLLRNEGYSKSVFCKVVLLTDSTYL